MNFDIKISNQSEEVVRKMQAAFFGKLCVASSKTKWMRLTGLGVGIVSGCLRVAMRIAAIFENTLKGVLNILSCNISTGLNQLLCQNLKQIFYLPFTALSAALNVIKATALMALNPNKYTADRWFEFDPKEKQEQEIRARKVLFDGAQSLLQREPNNVNALKLVADAYSQGIIVGRNEVLAFEYYERAARGGDADSMFIVGNSYTEGRGVAKNVAAAFGWFEKAAEKGDVVAMAYLGLYYENGPIAARNEELALKWLFAAANNGHVQAMQYYAIKHAKGNGVAKDLGIAVWWFKQAANRGDAISTFYLASILRQHPSLGTTDEWLTWFKEGSIRGQHESGSGILLEKF